MNQIPMSHIAQFCLERFRRGSILAVIFAVAPFAASQYSPVMGVVSSGGASDQSSASAQSAANVGSVPSGPASNEVLRLTLHDAINLALRFNLGTIESGENARIARGERLLALSNLLPQVSVGASENVDQTSLVTLGIRSLPGVPSVIGPYSYSSVYASLSETLFSFASIQRFRAARTAEQAALASKPSRRRYEMRKLYTIKRSMSSKPGPLRGSMPLVPRSSFIPSSTT
jgi:hypothetical protein